MIQNVDYMEMSTFDSTVVGEWTDAGGITTEPWTYNSRYAAGRTTPVFSFIPGGTVSKVFAEPIDISSYSEISLWYLSRFYKGALIVLGLGQDAPNDIGTHIILMSQVGVWGQDTWDITGLSQDALKSVKYVTFTANFSNAPIAPCDISFDELVARNETLVEAIGRNLRLLFNNVISTPNDQNTETPIPMVYREGEVNLEKLPEFLYHFDAPILDTTRSDNQRALREIIPNGGQYVWKISPKRRPYIVRLQIDCCSLQELQAQQMEQFVLQTLDPFGAISVAGDIIDCILSDTQTLDSQDAQQRMFRRIYVYDLRIWLQTAKIETIAVQSVDVQVEDYSDVAATFPGLNLSIYNKPAVIDAPLRSLEPEVLAEEVS